MDHKHSLVSLNTSTNNKKFSIIQYHQEITIRDEEELLQEEIEDIDEQLEENCVSSDENRSSFIKINISKPIGSETQKVRKF